MDILLKQRWFKYNCSPYFLCEKIRFFFVVFFIVELTRDLYSFVQSRLIFT